MSFKFSLSTLIDAYRRSSIISLISNRVAVEVDWEFVAPSEEVDSRCKSLSCRWRIRHVRQSSRVVCSALIETPSVPRWSDGIHRACRDLKQTAGNDGQCQSCSARAGRRCVRCCTARRSSQCVPPSSPRLVARRASYRAANTRKSGQRRCRQAMWRRTATRWMPPRITRSPWFRLCPPPKTIARRSSLCWTACAARAIISGTCFGDEMDDLRGRSGVDGGQA